MKKEIENVPILAYYSPKKQTVLQTDASIKGLGACLLQEEKPVYFASKPLTDALQGYGQWRNFIISSLQAISFWKLIRMP